MGFEMGGYRALTELDIGLVLGAAEGGWRGERIDDGTAVVLLTAADAAAGDALRAEFEAVGSLRHPHVLPVLDRVERSSVEPDGNRSAVVMPLPAGGSVAGRLADGPLSAGQVVTVLAGTASALAACHRRGFIHGNVTASMVVLSEDGLPMLARVGADRARRDLDLPARPSPQDVSPELARGAPPTAADDLFALGSLALRCLTGRPAWPAEDLRDVVVQSEFGQWPSSHGGGPAALTALIDGLLAADPAQRPTAAEVLVALGSCGEAAPLIQGGFVDPGVSDDSVPRDNQPDEAVARAALALGAGIRWLDIVGEQRAGERRAGERGVGGRGSPEPGAGPSASDEPSPGVRPRRSRRRQTRRRRPTRTSLATFVAAVVLGVVSIGAGIWWAGQDRPQSSVLTAVAPASADATGRLTVSGVAPVSSDGPDWLAVVRDLDERRAAAFDAGDADLLADVYVAASPAFAADARRVQELAAAGYRIDEPTHVITSAEVRAGPTDAAVQLRVVDSMPQYPIRDAVGAVVGRTVAVPSTERTVELVRVDELVQGTSAPGGSAPRPRPEYRITAIW